jgi:hypothetical protein
MDIMSIVSGILAIQDEYKQMQIAAAVVRPSAHAQKIAADTISAAQASSANLSPGVGGNLDVTT